MAGIEAVHRALLVEDQPDDERIVRAFLTGVHVDCVHSIKEAKQALAKGVYDVVLTDLHLSDSRGVETVTNVVALADGRPVIALTAKDPDVGEQVMQAGAQDFIAKDELSEQTLARAIRFGVHRIERTAERKRIAALISKDLHEPLSLLRGELDALAGTSLDDSQFESVEVMRRHLDRQEQVLTELRDFMKR